jgi:hypothetical protein
MLMLQVVQSVLRAEIFINEHLATLPSATGLESTLGKKSYTVCSSHNYERACRQDRPAFM